MNSFADLCFTTYYSSSYNCAVLNNHKLVDIIVLVNILFNYRNTLVFLFLMENNCSEFSEYGLNIHIQIWRGKIFFGLIFKFIFLSGKINLSLKNSCSEVKLYENIKPSVLTFAVLLGNLQHSNPETSLFCLCLFWHIWVQLRRKTGNRIYLTSKNPDFKFNNLQKT